MQAAALFSHISFSKHYQFFAYVNVPHILLRAAGLPAPYHRAAVRTPSPASRHTCRAHNRLTDAATSLLHRKQHAIV